MVPFCQWCVKTPKKVLLAKSWGGCGPPSPPRNFPPGKAEERPSLIPRLDKSLRKDPTSTCSKKKMTKILSIFSFSHAQSHISALRPRLQVYIQCHQCIGSSVLPTQSLVKQKHTNVTIVGLIIIILQLHTVLLTSRYDTRVNIFSLGVEIVIV